MARDVRVCMSTYMMGYMLVMQGHTACTSMRITMAVVLFTAICCVGIFVQVAMVTGEFHFDLLCVCFVNPLIPVADLGGLQECNETPFSSLI